MKCKKYYSVKQWREFKKIQVKEINGIKHHLDIQELMCKKYDIILTDYKTKRERIIIFLKKINMKDINKGIDTLNKAIQAFGGSMDQLSKEFGSSEKDTSNNDKKNLEMIWGKPKNKSNVKIWSDSLRSESRRKKDKMNLKKIWGDKFEM